MFLEAQTDELMRLYGRADDPLWNARIRSHLEAALEVAHSFHGPSYDPHSGAKLLLAYPQLAELALEALPQDPSLASLAEPSLAQIPAHAFDDPVLFLTPQVRASLRPLVVAVAERLALDPVELWPEGFQQEPASPAPELEPAYTKLRNYLQALEPYSPLLDLKLMGRSETGCLLWPVYKSQMLVFGGAQYFMGSDGGMLTAPNVYSFEELVEAYLAGERSPESPPATIEEAPEVWARNCGPTARAVVETLEGSVEAAATGTLGHWENGQFADGETLRVMLEAFGVQALPPLTPLSTVPELLRALPTGAHVVVGLRWKDTAYGHWFNARFNGAAVEWVDGQSGRSGAWPPPFIERAESDGVVIRPPARTRNVRRFLSF